MKILNMIVTLIITLTELKNCLENCPKLPMCPSLKHQKTRSLNQLKNQLKNCKTSETNQQKLAKKSVKIKILYDNLKK